MTARSPGEKRRRLAKRQREQAAYAALIAPLRAAGAACVSCRHYARAPVGFTGSHICEVSSDHDGYAMAKADGICPHYQQRAAMSAGARR